MDTSPTQLLLYFLSSFLVASFPSCFLPYTWVHLLLLLSLCPQAAGECPPEVEQAEVALMLMHLHQEQEQEQRTHQTWQQQSPQETRTAAPPVLQQQQQQQWVNPLVAAWPSQQQQQQNVEQSTLSTMDPPGQLRQQHMQGRQAQQQLQVPQQPPYSLPQAAAVQVTHMDIAEAVWAAGRLQHYNAAFSRALRPRFVGLLSGFSDRQLVSVLWGLARLGLYDGCNMDAAADEVRQGRGQSNIYRTSLC